ncbi:MAG: 30S ribosomal protein S17 [Chloroflexi bacterium]|nr:30S ribosomal protein S17 [Chloroflexota bacterium]
MAEEQTVNRKARVGTVVSDKNDKTIVVAVGRASRHRIYHKVIRRTKKYHAHDEQNAATLGDLVRIEEASPTSKLKRWRLVEILTEREVASVAPEAIDQSLVEEVQRSAAHAEADEAAVEAGAATESSDEEEGN